MEAVMASMFDLSGRVALVTGGGSGLGQEVSVGLAEFGADVVVADINLPGAEASVDRIRSIGGTGDAIAVDIADETSVEALFADVDTRSGRIDILVNAAFIPPIRTYPEDYPTEDWERVLGVDLTGYFLCTRAAGSRMIKAGRGGSIVSFSSIAATSALGRGNFAYSVAKAGVNQMTKELAIEWARHGIRVNAVQPCQFLTPALKAFMADTSQDAQAFQARVKAGIPLGHLGDPRDMVGPVVFLASPAAAMVTGVILPVDGGNLAMDAGASLTW
jgi:NAD(P)-dependent dehydrogenase (short-subunit alcohol dehydrogenase family)